MFKFNEFWQRIKYVIHCQRALLAIGSIMGMTRNLSGYRVICDDDAVGIFGPYPHEPAMVSIRISNENLILTNSGMLDMPEWIQLFGIHHEIGHLLKGHRGWVGTISSWVGCYTHELAADAYAAKALCLSPRRVQEALFLIFIGHTLGVSVARRMEEELPDDLVGYAKNHNWSRCWTRRLEAFNK